MKSRQGNPVAGAPAINFISFTHITSAIHFKEATMTIFDTYQKIHQKNIEEAENKRINNWLKHIDKSNKLLDDINILYMAAGNESNRVIKILINYIKRKWKNLFKDDKD